MKKPEVGYYFLKDELVPHVNGVNTAQAYDEMIDALIGAEKKLKQIFVHIETDDAELTLIFRVWNDCHKALIKAGCEL